jgi:hypothetical protein
MTLFDPSIPSAPADIADRTAKTVRLRTILDAHPEADALVLTSAEALAWYLGGARVTVPTGGAPVLALQVSRATETIYCLANEAERMMAEEVPGGLPVTVVPWTADLAREAAGSNTILSEHDITGELRAARASLLPQELARYRGLCTDLAALATDVLGQVTPQTLERDLAAAAAGGIVALGGEPVVILVAGRSRRHHRHPLPTDTRVDGEATLVLGARRRGMIANLTRRIRFEQPTAEVTASEQRILEVEADILRATGVGRSFVQVFADIVSAYPAHGFAADEWTRHHQGGPAGYLGRDPKLTPTTAGSFTANQAFAWNPTAPGVKVEDTMLLTDTGHEVLTVDPRWPTVHVNGVPRPTTLAG